MKHSQEAQKKLHNEEEKTYFLERSLPLSEYIQAGAKELSLKRAPQAGFVAACSLLLWIQQLKTPC